MIFYAIKPFTAFLRKICGIHLQVEGKENIPPKNGFLIVSNHYSYVESVCILSIIPAVPVSKAEVRTWPLIGWVTRLIGTIFVEREKGGLSGTYIEELIKTLKKGINIVFYPEGTTTDGTYLRPFKSALFVPANRLKVPVLPVVSKVTAINGAPFSLEQRDWVAWYDNAPLVPHVLRILSLRRIDIRYKIGKPIIPNYDDSSLEERRRFSEIVQHQMDAFLREIDPNYQGIRHE